MIKILNIINNLGSGGAEKLLVDLLPLLNKNENIKANILLLTDEKNVFYDSLIDKDIRIDVVKYKNIYDPRNIFEIEKYISNGDYDIVHSHLFPTQYWVALARVFIGNKKIKFVTTEHSTHNRRRERFYFRYIDKIIYSKYDKIISITEKTRDSLLKWIDCSHKEIDKYVVIENGVDIKKINVALPYKKSELIDNINENTKLVCMVGRFSEAKDQPTLIRAMSKLPVEIHLILVGEGPLMSHNKGLAEKLGISERVHFLGFRHDIPRILKTVDIVVLISHWEGFGLVAVEGMAAGKPVIATDVPGLVEIVGGAGIIVEKQNSKLLSEKILKLLENKTYYENIANACKYRSEKYDLSEVLNKLKDVYIEN